ncbi:MAG: flavodoxin family protein [Deltaproteobacteria bacterium]|nr:flavodoxin family protein [Deltaproteobacteria bacterium]
MKVVGFNGSPRKDGNTGILIHKIFEELEKEGIETEFIHLTHKKIHGCVSCYKCMENTDQRCAVTDDAANEYIEKISAAQGVVLGSPVYFMDVTPEMKALIDRVGFVSRSNGGMFRNKVGGLVSAARRTGAVHTLDTMGHFFLSMEMIIVGRAIGLGFAKGDVEKDEEGMMLVHALGQRMAWLMKMIYKGKG